MKLLTRADLDLIGWASMYLVSEASLIRVTGTGGPAYTALQVSPSATAYRGVLDRLDPHAATSLRNGYFANFHHPVLYAKALRMGARRLGEVADVDPRLLAVLVAAPAIACGADLTENLVNLRMHDDHDTITDSSVRLSSALSIVKWTGTVGPLLYMSQRFLRLWAQPLRRSR